MAILRVRQQSGLLQDLDVDTDKAAKYNSHYQYEYS
jgi:hypothetical protein